MVEGRPLGRGKFSSSRRTAQAAGLRPLLLTAGGLRQLTRSIYSRHNRHVGNYTNAGPTFSYARSGIFLRPGGDVAARKLVIESGSSYRNLVRDILPMLPTLGQVLTPSAKARPGRRLAPVPLCPPRHWPSARRTHAPFRCATRAARCAIWSGAGSETTSTVSSRPTVTASTILDRASAPAQIARCCSKKTILLMQDRSSA